MTKSKKVALALSGGLDASVISWPKENYRCEVVAICGDPGRDRGELSTLEANARASGAAEVYFEDLREEFVSQYLWNRVRSGAIFNLMSATSTNNHNAVNAGISK